MNDSTAVVLGLTSFLLFVVLYVWLALALAALFRKVGEEAWKGWVPYYNLAIVLKLGGFSPWLIFIGFVPLFGAIAFAVLMIISVHRISRGFGQGVGMTVLGALLFVVWASILGFGSARWIGAVPTAGPVRTGIAAPPSPYVATAPTLSPEVAEVGSPPAPATWAPQSSAASSLPAPPPLPTTAMPVVPSAFPPPPPLPLSEPLDDSLEDSAVDPEDRIAPAPRRTGSFTPPPPAPAAEPAPVVDPIAPIASVPGVHAAPARPVVDAPVTEVPAAPPASAATEPEPEPWAPVPTRAPATPEDGFPELSEAVSAVIGAPDAGSPRSARSSVSALYAQPEIPADAVEPDDDDDDIEAMDQTVIARRRRIPWALIPPGGSPVDISSDVVILGRRPAPDPGYPGAQLVSISDETRTVSKTHARLELRGESWYVTDLGSTNGVLFATLMGTEVEAQPGQEIEAGERFFLGDAEVRLTRSEG